MKRSGLDDSHASIPALIALGVGSMVGAGIFALMGEAAALAGSGVWISFAVAGIIALLTGHSFVQLGIRYPSRGGVVDYLAHAYGASRFSGTFSILFYIAQLIGMAMIALAFGTFLAALLGIDTQLSVWERLLGSGLILALSLLSLIGTNLVAQIQRKVVLANLLLLSGFTFALVRYGDPARLSPGTWPGGGEVLGSLALTFFAFTGFATISNATERMRNPARDLPRAMVGAIGIVMVLYIALALAITGVVTEGQLVSSGANLLPIAARSIFGEVGFKLLLISAVLSTITCLNGGLFGVTNITFTLATRRQLPQRFERQIGASTRGLTISAAVAILLLNVFSLSTIASLGGATSLFVYTLVNLGALRLVEKGGMTRVWIVLSVAACLLAIAVWMVYTLNHAPHTLGVFIVFLVIAFIIESMIQRVPQ
ncbi:APC family permease [Synechococcus sp. BSF8S]|nr:APC family permease [Synechococcus sp. BSF8S]